MSHLTPEESKKVEDHLAKAQSIHDKLEPGHHDIVNKHSEHFSTYINKTVRTGEKPSAEGLRSHIATRMGNEIDKVKTDKAKAQKTENMNAALAHHDTHVKQFKNALAIHHHMQAAKDILTSGIHKAHAANNPMHQTIDDKPTTPEGYAVHHKDQTVKFVNRGEFSRANFAATKEWKK